jgi:hypothetical protein
MTGCTRCGTRYPDRLVTPMMINSAYTMVCGVCALELSNQIHGTNRRKFTGEQAEQLRLDTVAWRKKHAAVKR